MSLIKQLSTPEWFDISKGGDRHVLQRGGGSMIQLATEVVLEQVCVAQGVEFKVGLIAACVSQAVEFILGLIARSKNKPF